MHLVKSLSRSKGAADPAVVDFREIGRKNVTEYILNMAMTALAHGDITPLYETYMEDPRLSDEARDELARAYLLLQMAATQTEDAR